MSSTFSSLLLFIFTPEMWERCMEGKCKLKDGTIIVTLSKDEKYNICILKLKHLHFGS